MEKKNFSKVYLSIGFIVAFFLWTVLLTVVDVKYIEEQDASIGFATVNIAIKQLIGSYLMLYVITDWLGLVPFFATLVFFVLGIKQLIQRKKIFKVDKDILALGILYVFVFSIYILFEYVVINYRPILINGMKEPSYPSSTTMLVACIMPTTIMQIKKRIKNRIFKNVIVITIFAFIIFMVIGRFLSGVHWFSDIVGGLLFSASVVFAYSYFFDSYKS